MSITRSGHLDRRQLLRLASGLGAMLAGLAPARAEEDKDPRPPVTSPRATSGDTVSEPRWSEQLSVTVGPQRADIVGSDQRAIQAAIDYLARLGGGTVRLGPGRYVLRNAVYLAPRVRIVGEGEGTILEKAPSTSTTLAADSDWYDQEITLTDPQGFEVGDGICLQTTNPHHGGLDVLKRTLVARDGPRFKLDRALRQNFWQSAESTVSTLFPIISGENVADVAIEHLVLDGNRAQNAPLDGNYAGCIFLQDARDVLIRGVTARNYNGDGISWQIAHDVRVEDCQSHDHAGLALHPGSGSQRPLIRGNRLARCDVGLFFCWGVRYGLAEGNQVADCRVGLSIGHRDTDNLIRGNRIAGSRDVGVLFRAERGPGFAPHRNCLAENEIVDNGPDDGVAVDVQGATRDVTLVRNAIRETRGSAGRIGIRISPETQRLVLRDNRIEGFARELADGRTPAG